MKTRALPLLAFLAVCGWGGCRPPVPPVQPDAPDAPQPVVVIGPVVVVDGGCTTTCDCLCSNEARHGCPEAAPTPKGKTCERVCQAVKDLKLPQDGIAADCIIKATTVAELRACNVKCEGGF